MSTGVDLFRVQMRLPRPLDRYGFQTLRIFLVLLADPMRHGQLVDAGQATAPAVGAPVVNFEDHAHVLKLPELRTDVALAEPGRSYEAFASGPHVGPVFTIGVGGQYEGKQLGGGLMEGALLDDAFPLEPAHLLKAAGPSCVPASGQFLDLPEDRFEHGGDQEN